VARTVRVALAVPSRSRSRAGRVFRSRAGRGEYHALPDPKLLIREWMSEEVAWLFCTSAGSGGCGGADGCRPVADLLEALPGKNRRVLPH
jgi:hypothetical protein